MKNYQKLLAGFRNRNYRNVSLSLNIRRFFTDVDGIILDKNTTPQSLRNPLPFFIFGEYDRRAGYHNGFSSAVLPPGVFLVGVFTYGVGSPFQFASGFNQVLPRLNFGDVYIVYTDNVDAPTWYIWITISSDGGSYSSVIANSNHAKIRFKNVHVFADNSEQFFEEFQVILSDEMGSFEKDNFSPISFKDPNVYKLNDYIVLPLSFNLSPFVCLAHNFTFASERINLVFNLD